MCSRFCLRIIFALFPAYASCLGSYEGNMPTTNVQKVSAHTFPERLGPEVKQVGNWIDSTYSPVHLPHARDTHRRYDRYQKERLIAGSNVKSDSKDCQTPAESDNQDNMINYKPSASVSNNHVLGFGQPSSQYGSRTATDVFKNVQPVSQLAYLSSQDRSTLMGTPKVLGSKPFKPSTGKSSYEVPKFSTAGSSKIFTMQAPEQAYGYLEPKLNRDTLVRGPNQAQSTISNQISHQHGSSKGSQRTGNVQTASGTYSQFLMGTPMHSRTNPKKTSHGGLIYTAAKPSIVSSGPIFVLQGSESTQGLGSYSKHPNSVKPHGVPSNVDSNQYVTPQSSQTSRITLNVNSQPSKYSIRGGQYNARPMPQKLSGSDCRDNVGKYSIASSGGILLTAPESVDSSKSHHRSHEDVQHPRKLQNTPGLSQSGSPVYSVSGSQSNQIFQPVHPPRSGAQHNVAKSSIASSGAIHIMQVPANVQSRRQSNKLQVTSHASLPERRVMFASSQTAPQYQPFEASQNSRNVQPITGTYTSPPQGGYHVFKKTPFKPGSVYSKPLSESGLSATKPSIADSNEINAVRVRLNKWPKSSFGNQWASGDNVAASSANSGALQSFLTPSNLGQKQRQNVQTPVGSSVPQYYSSKEVQSQSALTRENSDSTRHEITTIPNEFGKGVIRRLSPSFSSSYRPAPQQQAQREVSSAPECEVTQNHRSGLGQQGPVTFQGVKLTSSRSSSQRLP